MTPDPALEALLQFLKRSRGFDFTGYKRASLERRFRRRMEAVGCESFGDYLDYLEVHPTEYEELFDALLINVTEFFRDRQAWDHLRDVALQVALEGKPADEPIRVWSAGCATGEEACSVAMVLAEALGAEAYRERVKIYATDVDEDALAVARQSVYTDRAVQSVPEELRERYFERHDQRYAFRKDLRSTLIFGNNNLVEDAPISRLDLLVCRNTLMYFTAETQARILRHFHFALRPSGVLMLGKSEMMVSHRTQFTALDLKQRIFRRRDESRTLQQRVARMSADGDGSHVSHDGAGQDGAGHDGAGHDGAGHDGAGRDAALEMLPFPQIVVSQSGAFEFANVAARAMFSIGSEAAGRPIEELQLAADPGELRVAVDQAIRGLRAVAVGEAELRPPRGEPRRLDITVFPLMGGNVATGALVMLQDVSAIAAMRTELESNRRDLQAAYEELESTIDELETTNEELQSSNEELQTTNEELQSTNEELETMNEELQSTNEELETINDELRDRTGELNRVNEFLEAILTSLGFAVIVLDKAQRVLVWNAGAEDLWGLRAGEAVDQHFLGLDIGLGAERLAGQLRAVISGASGGERAELDAVNRRGRPIVCQVTVVPLAPHSVDGVSRGAILLMEEKAA